MAQLRQDYESYQQRDTVIFVIGPENADGFRAFWEENELSFIGLPDPAHSVLKQYGQQVSLFKFGRMPAQMIVDKAGVLRYVHYGHDMTDIPSNTELLALLDELQAEVEQGAGRER